MPSSLVEAGLTTGKAAFIDHARSNGELFVEQLYALYSEENHRTWRHLHSRLRSRWDRHANEAFLHGIQSLCLDPERIPRLADVNRFLMPLTGFQAKAVSGYVPAYVFFDCLRRRQFPTTITIRRGDSLDYLPEPDIFHDIAGHVPCTRTRPLRKQLYELVGELDSWLRAGRLNNVAPGEPRVDEHNLDSFLHAAGRVVAHGLPCWSELQLALLNHGLKPTAAR